MRLALLVMGGATAVVAWLLWAASRDLKRPWTWPSPDMGDDDMAGVQVDIRPYTVTSPVGGM
jgi:hypothetical protein